MLLSSAFTRFVSDVCSHRAAAPIICLWTVQLTWNHLFFSASVKPWSSVLPQNSLRPAQGRTCFRPLTLVQPSSGKYLTCLSFLFQSLNVPVSWSVTHTHTLCVFSHYPGFFFYKQTILSNSSFVSHHISTDHPFIPGCFPAQRQSTSLAIPVFIFSFLRSSKPQAEVIVLTKGQLNQSKATLHYIGYIVFSQNIQDCFTFHEVSPQFMEMVLFSVVSESQREG